MSDTDTIRLYKFYSAQWGVDSLKKTRLKISTLDDLNDPFEFNGFSFKNKKDRLAWLKTRKQLWQNKGLISFSDRWSNPVIWSHYAENHKGICLGFDVSKNFAFKVLYPPTREHIPSISEIVDTNDSEVLKKMSLTKYAHWEYENEWRVFIKLGQPDNDLFFEGYSDKMQLREIIIGAESDLSSQQLRRHCSNSVEVHTARLAFKAFRIVPQKLKRLQK